MSATLDIIKERFPGRATLLPEEVAEVIFGNSDPATVQGVRTNLKKGILVEGLLKRGGRWLVPVGPLADALERRAIRGIFPVRLSVFDRRKLFDVCLQNVRRTRLVHTVIRCGHHRVSVGPTKRLLLEVRTSSVGKTGQECFAHLNKRGPYRGYPSVNRASPLAWRDR